MTTSRIAPSDDALSLYSLPPLRRSDHTLAVLAGLFAAGLATFALLYAPQPLLPALAATYGLGPATASLALSVSTAGLVLGVVPVAVVAHRLGHRTVIILSLVAASVLGLLAAAAPDWGLLLLLRGLQGVALAGVPATAVAYATEATGLSRAGLMSGLYIAGTTVGGLSGRILGGVLGDLGGWRLGIGGVACASVLATALAWLLLPGFPVRRPATPARARAAWQDPLAALWREADRLQLGLCLIGALLMTAFVATYNGVAFRLAAPPYGLSQSAVGLVFLVYLAGTAASAVAGRLADRIPPRVLVVVSALLLSTGAGLTVAASLTLVIMGLGLLTAGFFAAHGVASGWVGRAAQTHRGTASARYTVWYYAGSTVGGPLGGWAFGLGGWYATSALVGALGVGAAATALVLPDTH